MPRFKATITKTFGSNGIHFDKGMSVFFVASSAWADKKAIAEAFIKTHNRDIAKANAISNGYLEIAFQSN